MWEVQQEESWHILQQFIILLLTNKLQIAWKLAKNALNEFFLFCFIESVFKRFQNIIYAILDIQIVN